MTNPNPEENRPTGAVVQNSPPEYLDLPQVVALDQEAMVSGHARLLEWARLKCDAVNREILEELVNLDIARRRKYATKPFQLRISRLKKRGQFFWKMVAALEAGYVLVPNFDVELFAIRTKAKTPRGGRQRGRYNAFPQNGQFLAIGEGRYVDPNPFIRTEESERPDGKGGTIPTVHQWPTGFDDTIEFPLLMATPALMSTAGEAMALKLFDELGVARDTRRRITRPDPIMIGIIRNPSPNRPDVSFFLGWRFDPTSL